MHKIFQSYKNIRKSNSQRQAEWKLKNLEKAKLQNIQKNKAFRERLKNKMTDEEKKIWRDKEAERKRLFRLKKKENIAPTRKAAFATPQIKGKLLKRTRDTLRGTPAQNLSILKHLIEEYADVSVAMNSTRKCLPEATVAKVTGFYFNDEISRASPNVKDYVMVKEGNKRKKVSVKHLMYPIKEVYAMFCEENPDLKVSVSKFFNLRPVNVLSFTKMPHNVCCCHIHENVRFMLKSLQKADIVFKDMYVDYGMHKNFVCDPETENCFTNECSTCKNVVKIKTLARQVENQSQFVTWSKWVKVERNKKTQNCKTEQDDNTNQYCNIEKVKKTNTITELLEELYQQIPEFLNHEFIKKHQAEVVAKLIELAVLLGSDIAVICIDFAENFKCFNQNEPQSAHYGQTPVTVFTIAIYHRGFTPMAIASECEKHYKESILAYLDVIIDQLPTTVKKIYFWSDNPTSQFKNQFIMEGMRTLQTRHEKIISWNFYAAMHGKSVVDGIGGSVKRYVRDRILTHGASVKSAEDFVTVASKMAVKVILMKNSDIAERNKLIGFDKIIKNSKRITGISNFHFFEVKHVKTKKTAVEKVVGYKVTPTISVN